MTPSDHCDGRRFFNPGGAGGRGFREVPRLLRAPRTPWPRRVAVVPRPLPGPASGRIAVTWIGHATFLLQSPDAVLLTDPMWSRRAGPLPCTGPRRVRPPSHSLGDLPRVDVVLLSHNHYDHCDRATLRALARRFDPLLVTPLGNGRLARRAGLGRVEELDWWQSSGLAPCGVTLTPAQHFSARTPFDRNRALWGGFVIASGGRTIFFAGDSGYGPHFRQIGARLGPLDLALLPIGAYEPRWFMRDIHMDPAEAVQAHRDCGARRSVAMHFGTFQLTPEGMDDPPRALAEARARLAVPDESFLVLEAGASLIV